ncbi:MAG TPA: histidine triad nucleotide-binding protein [Candidatus Binatia bacterium]|nr:histidine triad nucleotide-binding protein [Candidatus Binatia bacterium]
MSDCLFCDIVEGRVKGDIVYRDESVVAFKDIRPQAPVHILVVPRKHVATMLDLEGGDSAVVGQIFLVIARLAREQGIADRGFRVVVNSGADAGQSVFHVHFHLLGGRPFRWPPG